MAGAIVPAVAILGLTGCASQEFLTDGITQFVDTAQSANRFRDSNEPQTNDVEYELGTHDIKEVEEVPLEILEDFDMTGPQNNGILKTDTNTIDVGNEELDVEQEGKSVYVYTVGNPEESTSGIAKLHFEGAGKEQNGVILPANADTLKKMLGVDSPKSIKTTADNFQKLLVDYSLAADAAYKGAKKKDSDWCVKVENGNLLDKYWSIDKDYPVADDHYIEYKVAGSKYKACVTGYYGNNIGNQTLYPRYVTLNRLFMWYVFNKCYDTMDFMDPDIHDEQPSIYTVFNDLGYGYDNFNDYKGTGDNKDIYTDSKIIAKRTAFFVEMTNERLIENAVKIPALNETIFQMYSFAPGSSYSVNTKLNSLELANQKSKCYSLPTSFKQDSYLNNEYLTKETAVYYKDIGQKIATNFGTSMNAVLDKSESDMYHSLLSGYVGANNIGAKAFIFVDYGKEAKVNINATEDILADVKKAFEGNENVAVNKLSGDSSKLYEMFGIPTIRIVAGNASNKVDDSVLEEVASILATTIKQKYGS